MNKNVNSQYHRCEYRHNNFLLHEHSNLKEFKHDGSNQCWMRETKKIEDKYFCAFHMPENHEDEECQKLQSLTLRELIEEWNADKEINVFLMFGMRCGEIDFNGITFKSDAYFNESTFTGDTIFNKTIFSGSIHFGKSTFLRNPQFNKASFANNAFFDNVKFIEGASFGEATFYNNAIFFNAKFSQLTYFAESIFRKDAMFSGAKFNGYAFFYRCLFKKICAFESVAFNDVTNFNRTEIYIGPDMGRCSFKKAPSFHDVSMSQSVIFREARFSDVISEDAAANYRTLKVAMNKASNKIQEGVFYGLEQASLRNQPEAKFSFKLFSRLYEKSSNYGQSLTKPIRYFVSINTLFFFIYCCIKFPMTRIYEYVNSGLPNFGDNLSLVVSFIFSNIPSVFKIGSSTLVKDTFGDLSSFQQLLVSILALSQSLISITLITLFILAIRRIFKLN